MLKIRPVQLKDHKQVLELAIIAGVGMSSLPQDAKVLRGRIQHAAESFKKVRKGKKDGKYLFVLEDGQTKKLAGTTGITAHVGLKIPFYSYKLSTITQASSSLGIYSLQQVLHMVNDYTDASEVGSLFLHPDYRQGGNGRFLSRARYMMMAEFPKLFSDTIISEIRGVQDKAGNSPFYDNLVKHFFKVDFRQADYIYATQGAQFIADLMPRYPIYVNMLSPQAQQVIGVPLDASRPAMKLLEAEGFHYEGYVDLFDAGPTLQAERAQIHTVKASRKAVVKNIRPANSETYMICNTRLEDFSIVQGCVEVEKEGVAIAPEVAKTLGITKGDKVRYAL